MTKNYILNLSQKKGRNEIRAEIILLRFTQSSAESYVSAYIYLMVCGVNSLEPFFLLISSSRSYYMPSL